MKYALIAALLGSAGIAATSQMTTLFDKTDANGNRLVIIDGGGTPGHNPAQFDIQSYNSGGSTFETNRAFVPSDRMKALMEKMDAPIIK